MFLLILFLIIIVVFVVLVESRKRGKFNIYGGNKAIDTPIGIPPFGLGLEFAGCNSISKFLILLAGKV